MRLKITGMNILRLLKPSAQKQTIYKVWGNILRCAQNDKYAAWIPAFAGMTAFAYRRLLLLRGNGMD